MWSHGQWVVPHLNGAPYSHKVPLLFWMIHAGWFVFGVNDIWPRVLEVIFGAVQLVLAATLARRLFPARPWVARATPWLLLSLSYAFLFGLQIMYEVLLTVWVLGALLSLAPRPGRAAPRWWLFGLCIGFGLLTKGPVMLLHVVFPWLLGPLWSDWARNNRVRWYGFGLLGLLGGCAMLAAWVWPAIHLGGEAYAHQLLFKQTAGRVVEAFDHARPWYWYLTRMPLLLFPLILWPRAWAALVTLRRPLDAGLRFALCWLLPMLLAFSAISGKQAYYFIPELAGTALLVGGALAVLRERRPRLSASAWLGTWPLAIGAFAFAALLLALPALTGVHGFDSHWVVDLARYSRYFAIIYVGIGVLVSLRGRGELRRLAIAGLIGTVAAFGLFVATSWQNYDMRPAARLLGRADAAGQAIVDLGPYAGQYHFLGRLRHPIKRIRPDQLADWAARHPQGLVLTSPETLRPADLHYAQLVHPFRSSWVVIWRARVLVTLRAGGRPPEPLRSTQLYPHGYWRYRGVD
ncbi:MAG TPA: glycosyltransferase family 39 protein [Rhodanobacteraceae bacterium]|nr:glycosyltransferase family 39 protein [Rhodanobacteraceae bacterium]